MTKTIHELPAESLGMYQDKITKKLYEVFKIQRVVSETFWDGTTESDSGTKRFYCEDVDGKNYPINVDSEDLSSFKLVIGNNIITKV